MNLPGLDLQRLDEWMRGAVPDVTSPLTADLVQGGKSNLTYFISDGRKDWVLRRPPLGHVLATAHDMSREYRVMRALEGTAVPVPRTYALCVDETVIGSEFYIMERCAGTPYRRTAELEALGAERTSQVAWKLVDTLVALHSLDTSAIGLSDFGRPSGFLDRQVRRWKHQLDSSQTQSRTNAVELHRLLALSIPAESSNSVVHGDYRLDNLLIDQADEVTAVLDWEMATLGDPLTDLALMVTYHRLGASIGEVITDAALAPGFPSESEIVDRYGAASGRDLSDLGWYLGLAAFKLAVILEGIHFRYLAGQTVGPGFDRVGSAIDPLIQAGLAELAGRD